MWLHTLLLWLLLLFFLELKLEWKQRGNMAIYLFVKVVASNARKKKKERNQKNNTESAGMYRKE